LLLTYKCIAFASFSKYSQEIHKEVNKSPVKCIDTGSELGNIYYINDVAYRSTDNRTRD